MRADELRALGELAGAAASGTAEQIKELHLGIAERVWRAVGPAATPVRVLHDQLAALAYAGAEGLIRASVRGGTIALSAAIPPQARSIQGAFGGRAAVGALNGIWGDTLARRRSGLELRMALRHAGADLEVTPTALARAYPTATGRIAVFVHGLCETDDAWMLAGARHVPYGFRLQAELGFTPLFLRYNTGLHISSNGRTLAELLERVVADWPTEVHEIAFIGHSMGGLVARSACHYGEGAAWAPKVRHVFTLGAPHLGAPLEQAAHAASALMARLPETRALISRPLNLRSAGIKDLRYGYLTDECWLDQDCDAFVRNTGKEVPFMPSASHYFVCATLTRDPESLAARVIGDLLVLQPSAWSRGRGQQLRFPIEHYHHVGSATHFDLLNHPAIYAQVKRWMAPRTALPAPAAQRP